MISIAIDGPSGAGKSTLARKLAQTFGFIYVDTGAMYRTIGLYALQNGVQPKEAQGVTNLLAQIHMDLRYVDGAQHIFLNNEDVSEHIRTAEVSMAASHVSAHPAVRAFLLDTQRNLGANANIIMDGRDIGTVVLPNANVKIFLTATPEDRAQRRFEEMRAKGENVSYEEVLADVKQRDYNDSTRAAAPLCQADDAVLVDTTGLVFTQSFTRLKTLIVDSLRAQGIEIGA